MLQYLNANQEGLSWP